MLVKMPDWSKRESLLDKAPGLQRKQNAPLAAAGKNLSCSLHLVHRILTLLNYPPFTGPATAELQDIPHLPFLRTRKSLVTGTRVWEEEKVNCPGTGLSQEPESQQRTGYEPQLPNEA